MRDTKIEWCDATWNPISGCYGGCPYCYARQMANRFQSRRDCVLESEKGVPLESSGDIRFLSSPRAAEMSRPAYFRSLATRERTVAPYPFGFMPTLRRYALDDIGRVRRSKNIFVCSMADLFGEGIPSSWIDAVFEACERNPQHRYFFLTKHPERYVEYGVPIRKNMWYGTTITKRSEVARFNSLPAWCRTFVSIEPILEDLRPEQSNILFRQVDWIILGSETGNRKEKVVPKKEWIDKIVRTAWDYGTALFMKESLLPIMGEKGMLRTIPSW